MHMTNLITFRFEIYFLQANIEINVLSEHLHTSDVNQMKTKMDLMKIQTIL
jgi:hypothetical protein